jgi:hypothetical protein
MGVAIAARIFNLRELDNNKRSVIGSVNEEDYGTEKMVTQSVVDYYVPLVRLADESTFASCSQHSGA